MSTRVLTSSARQTSISVFMCEKDSMLLASVTLFAYVVWVLVHKHVSAFWRTLWSCATASPGQENHSVVAFLPQRSHFWLSVFYIQTRLYSAEERKQNSREENIRLVWASAQVPFLMFCPLFHGNIPFTAICLFPYLPPYSPLSVVSPPASASRHTAVATENPPGVGEYVDLHAHMPLCVFTCVWSWAERGGEY